MLSLPEVIERFKVFERDFYHVECVECGAVCGVHVRWSLGSQTFGDWRDFYLEAGWSYDGGDWTCTDCQEG